MVVVEHFTHTVIEKWSCVQYRSLMGYMEDTDSAPRRLVLWEAKGVQSQYSSYARTRNAHKKADFLEPHFNTAPKDLKRFLL